MTETAAVPQSKSEKLTGRIDSLLAKASRLEARKILAEGAERKKKADTERTRNERKKYLVGAWLLDQMKGEADFRLDKAGVLKGMAWFLKRDNDRKLFDLEPLPPAPPAPEPVAAESTPITPESTPRVSGTEVPAVAT